MKTLFIALLALVSLPVFAQQDKMVQDPNAKPRTISADFNAVSVGSGIELYLSQGSSNSLAVSMNDEKYNDKFITEVVNGVLKIYFDNKGMPWNNNDRKRKLKAYLSVKSIVKLSGSSGSRTLLTNTIEADKFDMNYSSGATFRGTIKVSSLSMDQSSGADVELSGTASTTKIEASSGAMFKGYGFSTSDCTARASSGAAINISISKELSAKASSGAIIHYKGDAVIREMNTSSGAVIKKA